MKPLESLTANKWHPQQNSGKSLYPSPQSILRKAVGAEEYKFVSETVTTEHIRAAVIMPLNVPFQHLLENVPWGMSYKSDEWRMIIVSVLEPVKWLTIARASGAIAWLKGHSMTYTYNWEPPPMDEHGLKKRPPNALGITGEIKPSMRRKEYDREKLIEDLKLNEKTHIEIANKYGVSRITVHNTAKKLGLTVRKK